MSPVALMFLMGLLSAPEPVSAAAPPPAPAAADTGPSAACRSAVDRDWPRVGEARKEGRYDEGVRLVTAMETACADHAGAMGLLGTLHAELDLLAGRHAEAADRAARAPLSPEDSIWPTNRWVQLAALEMTGDADRFRVVRDEMLAVHDAALVSHGRHRMKKVERFETSGAVVDAYEGLAEQDMFRRHYVFVAAPKNGGMPVTLSLTRSMAVEFLMPSKGNTTTYIYDLYPCEMHATLDMVDGRKDKAPAYDKVKARALKTLESPDTFKPFARRDEPRFCAFESYMLPGFDPIEVEEEGGE